MKNTPSALKWLAEKRARIAFDLDTKQKILRDLEAQIADLQVDLAAVDRTITIYDSRIDPGGIEPINGWKGSYGKRGALKEAVKECVRAASPNAISSLDLETLICLKFSIAFITPAERDKWREGGFRSAIKALVRDGLIERLGDPVEMAGQVAHFRWKEQVDSFESLERHVAMKAGSCASLQAS